MGAAIRMTAWYLRHPSLYGEFLRKAGARIKVIGLNREKEKARSVKWCDDRAVSTEAAIQQITGSPARRAFREKFIVELQAAKQALERCPVKMGGAGDLELIYHLAEHIKAVNVIETGVASGWSTLAFLLSLRERRGSMLVSTDMPYIEDNADKYVGCVVPQELRGHWELLTYPDRKGLPMALKMLPVIDMCHYDSDKSYEGRAWAYPKLWEALRPGGIFISDDVDDNFGLRDFCSSIGREPVIVKTRASVGYKYIGVLVK